MIDILTPIQLKNTVLTDKDWFYQIIKPCNKIALRKQTVIDPKFHNQKVGSKLIKHSIKESISISDIQISTVWKKKHSNTMNKILLKNGFYLYKEIINYWEEDSLIKKYNCPICGIPPCKCSTEVYIKKKH
ncbi:hypothetical protein N9242_00645 [Vicingaceae bacterium]|nr:hypothetical protein [Vicingaceae bacterium]